MLENLTNGITIVMKAPPATYFKRVCDLYNPNDDFETNYERQKQAIRDRNQYNEYVEDFMRDVKDEIVKSVSNEIMGDVYKSLDDILKEIKNVE